MQMCGNKCTYRIRNIDVTSCEDKSRDNISMPSRRRQVQGIASILQQVGSSFSLPQLQEVHQNHVISGFRREITQNCALLVYHVASSDNLLPTFRDNLSVPSSGFKILED